MPRKCFEMHEITFNVNGKPQNVFVSKHACDIILVLSVSSLI